MHYMCSIWFIYAVYVCMYHQTLSVDLQVKFNFCFSCILKMNKQYGSILRKLQVLTKSMANKI